MFVDTCCAYNTETHSKYLRTYERGGSGLDAKESRLQNKGDGIVRAHLQGSEKLDTPYHQHCQPGYQLNHLLLCVCVCVCVSPGKIRIQRLVYRWGILPLQEASSNVSQ